MPWSYTIDTENGFLSVKATGVFSDADLQSMRLVTTSDPRFFPEIRALFDYLEVNKSEVTHFGVTTWAMAQRYGPQSRRAIIVNPGLHEAIALAFRHSIAQAQNGHVFVANNREDAVAWLNEGWPADKRLA